MRTTALSGWRQNLKTFSWNEDRLWNGELSCAHSSLRWCEIVPLGENSLQFCTYWRDADIFSTEYFTCILLLLLIDWCINGVCVQSDDSGRILYNIIHLIVLCSNTVLHHVKGNNVWSPAFIYGKVVIHLPFSWLTHLSLTWGPHIFIYLFI